MFLKKGLDLWDFAYLLETVNNFSVLRERCGTHLKGLENVDVWREKEDNSCS